LRLLGKHFLMDLTRQSNTRAWALSWAAEICAANWKQAADVRLQFPKALEPSPNCFTFPVAESSLAVVLNIAFPHGIAVITHLIRWGENA
jgi:mRNA-degrading endonuclease HigB of HigAB toxin-antitoxin module